MSAILLGVRWHDIVVISISLRTKGGEHAFLLNGLFKEQLGFTTRRSRTYGVPVCSVPSASCIRRSAAPTADPALARCHLAGMGWTSATCTPCDRVRRWAFAGTLFSEVVQVEPWKSLHSLTVERDGVSCQFLTSSFYSF